MKKMESMSMGKKGNMEMVEKRYHDDICNIDFPNKKQYEMHMQAEHRAGPNSQEWLG